MAPAMAPAVSDATGAGGAPAVVDRSASAVFAPAPSWSEDDGAVAEAPPEDGAAGASLSVSSDPAGASLAVSSDRTTRAFWEGRRAALVRKLGAQQAAPHSVNAAEGGNARGGTPPAVGFPNNPCPNHPAQKKEEDAYAIQVASDDSSRGCCQRNASECKESWYECRESCMNSWWWFVVGPLAFLVCVAVAYALNATVSTWEIKRAGVLFTNGANAYMDQLFGEVKAYGTTLEGLAALARQNPNFTRAEFADAVNHTFSCSEHHKYLASLGKSPYQGSGIAPLCRHILCEHSSIAWAPYVNSSEQRARLERDFERDTGIARRVFAYDAAKQEDRLEAYGAGDDDDVLHPKGIPLWTQYAYDKPIVEPERDSYVVVNYIEPMESHSGAALLNLASEPTRNATIQRARTEGNQVISSRIQLTPQEAGLADDGFPYAALMMKPVFDTFGDGSFLGVFEVTLRYDSLVERAAHVMGSAQFMLWEVGEMSLEEREAQGKFTTQAPEPPPRSSINRTHLPLAYVNGVGGIKPVASHLTMSQAMAIEEDMKNSQLVFNRFFLIEDRWFELTVSSDVKRFTASIGGQSNTMLVGVIIVLGLLIAVLTTVATVVYRRNMQLKSTHVSKLEIESERLDAEKRRLETESRAMERFVRMTSHDLRSPLQTIVFSSQMLMDERREDQRRDLVDTIRECGVLLEAIVGNTLDMAHIQSGCYTVNEARVGNMAKLLDAALLAVRTSVNPKIDVVTCVSDLPAMLVDAEKLSRIALNLLSNAAKFTTEGKIGFAANLLAADDNRVPAATRNSLPPNSNAMLFLGVSDTGRGISSAVLPKLGDAYVHVSLKEGGGNGLGLFIVSQFVKACGGAWHVETEPGKGTCVSLLIPVRRVSTPRASHLSLAQSGDGGSDVSSSQRATMGDDGSIDAVPRDEDAVGISMQQERAKAPSPPPSFARGAGAVLATTGGDGKAPLILVVDDNALIRKMTSRLLERNGFRVMTAADGMEAFALVTKGNHNFACVLMDVDMPVMDGNEACKRIRSWEAARGVPMGPGDRRLFVCTMSGNVLERDRNDAMEAGADDFVGKPVTASVLTTLIENACRPASMEERRD